MMNRKIAGLFGLAAFVAGCITTMAAREILVPPIRAQSSAPRWEYSCAWAEYTFRGDLSDPFKAKLNEFGAQGWDLAAVDNAAGNGGRYCFKRPL